MIGRYLTFCVVQEKDGLLSHSRLLDVEGADQAADEHAQDL